MTMMTKTTCCCNTSSILQVLQLLLAVSVHRVTNVHSFVTPTTGRISSAVLVRSSPFVVLERTTRSVRSTRTSISALASSDDEDSSSNNGSGSGRKRRRRRKDGKNIPSIEEEQPQVEEVETVTKDKQETTAPPLVPQSEPEKEPTIVAKSEPSSSTSSEPVQLQVMDIRNVVSSGSSSTSSNSDPSKVKETLQNQNDIDDNDEYEYVVDDEDDDDDEYEYYYEDENNNEVIIASGSKDTSLEALLADAKRMRKETEEGDGANDENSISIPGTIKSVISTIVTIDFFVVCALLAWFLAGIFCSYIIKDDTVQIAFNGIFEPVVQPALGVLMIGSAAGAVFKEPEKE